MAKRRKAKTQIPIVARVFIAILVLIVAFISVRYYRRYTYNQQVNQELQAQLNAQKQAAAKELQVKKDFIKLIGPIAQKVDRDYKLLPSITIAQACLESDYGRSDLARKYHNLFGVKSADENTSVKLKTKEFVNNKWIEIVASFQIYDSYESSIAAHARLFQVGTTWNPNQYAHVNAATDYKSQAKALVTDGYATDPDYSTKLISLIQEFSLDQYDH